MSRYSRKPLDLLEQKLIKFIHHIDTSIAFPFDPPNHLPPPSCLNRGMRILLDEDRGARFRKGIEPLGVACGWYGARRIKLGAGGTVWGGNPLENDFNLRG